MLLLTAPESDAVPAALEYLTKHAEKCTYLDHQVAVTNRSQLLQLKIIPLLLSLSQSKHVNIRKLSAACIGSVSEMGIKIN